MKDNPYNKFSYSCTIQCFYRYYSKNDGENNGADDKFVQEPEVRPQLVYFEDLT